MPKRSLNREGELCPDAIGAVVPPHLPITILQIGSEARCVTAGDCLIISRSLSRRNRNLSVSAASFTAISIYSSSVFATSSGSPIFVKETLPDSRRMPVAGKRDNRHAHPEGLACRGRSVVGKGVEGDVDPVVRSPDGLRKMADRDSSSMCPAVDPFLCEHLHCIFAGRRIGESCVSSAVQCESGTAFSSSAEHPATSGEMTLGENVE